MADRGSKEDFLLRKVFTDMEEWHFNTKGLMEDPTREQVLQMVLHLMNADMPSKTVRMNLAKLFMDRY